MMSKSIQINRILFGIVIFLSSNVRSQELRNATACSEEFLLLECAANEVIAVHSAYFDGNHFDGCMMLPINITALLPNAQREIRRFSAQSAVNKHCSGMNNCTVLLSADEPQAPAWGNGKLHVQYYCIAAKSARFSCNSVIEILAPAMGEKSVGEEKPKHPVWYPGPATVSGWGYVQNTAYPEYYRGGHQCTWTIRAPKGRRVLLTLLDLSIRSVLHGEPACKDYLMVTEGSRLLMEKCGEIQEPIVIESSENELNLTLTAKLDLYPKRGVFAHFTAVGCPTPKYPKQGYLVHGNMSHAEFMCCVDHVFPDTGKRFRNLTCLEGYRWSEDLPDCVEIRHIVESGNSTLLHILRQAQQNVTEPKVGELMNSYSFTYDLIVPSTIIACLIVGNVFIAVAVMQCRRKRKSGEAAGTSVSSSQQEGQVGTPV